MAGISKKNEGRVSLALKPATAKGIRQLAYLRGQSVNEYISALLDNLVSINADALKNFGAAESVARNDIQSDVAIALTNKTVDNSDIEFVTVKNTLKAMQGDNQIASCQFVDETDAVDALNFMQEVMTTQSEGYPIAEKGFDDDSETFFVDIALDEDVKRFSILLLDKQSAMEFSKFIDEVLAAG